jgi:hypothetical protein
MMLIFTMPYQGPACPTWVTLEQKYNEIMFQAALRMHGHTFLIKDNHEKFMQVSVNET